MIARHTLALVGLKDPRMTLPPVKAKLLEGKKGLIVGIANDRSIAWGCARAFRALGADLAITYLNEKAKPHVEPLAREVEAPIFMPMDVMADGAARSRLRPHRRRLGRARLRRPLDRLLHQGRARRPRHRRAPPGLPGHHGRLGLVVPAHGPPRRAADEERRHALHHDLLRLREGGGELQHHGRRQGRPRIRPSATSPPSSARRASASTPSPPAPSPPAPPPASPSSTRCWRRPRARRPPAPSSTSTTSAWPAPSSPTTPPA